MFSPDVDDNRAPGEKRRITLHPSDVPDENVIEVTVTTVSSGTEDVRYFRLTEVEPTWRNA